MESQQVEEFFSTSWAISLYMDFVTRTFQRELMLRQRSIFNEREILYILDSLVGGLAFLQSKGIAHEHLNFHNIYIVILPSGNTCLKVSPFEIREPDIEYPSPEQMQSAPYNHFKSDVFTLGVLMLELCTLTKCGPLYEAGQVREDDLRELLLKVTDRYSERLYEYLNLMLQINPRNR